MNDCACLYSDYDADVCEFSSFTIRTARKQHVCAECRQPIVPGTRYEYFAGKSDGDVFAQKTCLLCVEIRTAFYCDSLAFGQLWEDIHEQMFPPVCGGLTSACLDKLKTPEAKQFLQRQWWQWVQAHTPAAPPEDRCEACKSGYRLGANGIHYDDAVGGRTWGLRLPRRSDR